MTREFTFIILLVDRAGPNRSVDRTGEGLTPNARNMTGYTTLEAPKEQTHQGSRWE